MQSRKIRQIRCAMVAALGGLFVAAAPAQKVSAQLYPSGEINISGATLFVDFFRFPASTTDFIDVDSNGVSGFNGGFPQQLAKSPTIVTSPSYSVTPAVDNYWTINYRSVGSVNGFTEFVNYQTASTIPTSIPSEAGLYNRVEYATNGAKTALGNPGTPSGIPIAQTSVDLGAADVPTTWAIQSLTGSTTDAKWNRVPTEAGYGKNPTTSTTGQSNKLAVLNGLNVNTSSPDANTIFDSQLAWVPVQHLANAGTGVENIKMTEVQHLYVTGRMPSGENFVVVTRDSGSGTRNAGMNGSGIDPSFGIGDNDAAKTDSSGDDNLGANYKSANRGGSSRSEGALKNHRLAIGYTGLFGPSRAAQDAVNGDYEILNVMNDHLGGTTYVRPRVGVDDGNPLTVDNNIIQNGDVNDSYRVGAFFTLSSRGNPFEADPLDPTYMANQAAAGYIVNLEASIDAFVSVPGDVNNIGMPGELLADRFTLRAALDNVPSDSDPTILVANPDKNAALQVANINALAATTTIPAYGSVGAGAGRVPTRTTLGSGTYTDGGTGTYKDIDGNNIAAGFLTNLRNKIAGDFDGDQDRDTSDVPMMMKTLAYRASVAAKPETGTGYAPEILGDFNGDGNFTAADARYWADGLHIVAGKLDRKAGFTAVDTEWLAAGGANVNYFGTTKATGKAYAAGDSRADIAGVSTAKGGKKSGADGAVNAADIDYVFAQYIGINAAGVDWLNLDDAAFADLSADITGNLVIDNDDVVELVEDILGTRFGDANLDGDVNDADYSIVLANFGTGTGWATGDFDGSKSVRIRDAMTLLSNYGYNGPTSAEITLIPEPASLALLTLGGLAMLRRRR